MSAFVGRILPLWLAWPRGLRHHAVARLPACLLPGRLKRRGRPAWFANAARLLRPPMPCLLPFSPFPHRSQGASKNVTYQEWDKIWSINKRVIDPVCPRHTAVETDGR